MNNKRDKLEDYIITFDNVFTKEDCKKYIDYIEQGNRSPGTVGDFAKGSSGYAVRDWYKKSEDICFSSEYPEEIPYILDKCRDYISKYQDITKCEVPIYKTELICGRVYRKNTGFYKTHVDAGSPISIDRTLSLLFYLNTIEEGGELVFPKIGKKINVVEGRLVIFPSNWMFAHKANMPKSHDRYLIRVFTSGINFEIREYALYYKELKEQQNAT